jgi:hypothetical protein
VRSHLRLILRLVDAQTVDGDVVFITYEVVREA